MHAWDPNRHVGPACRLGLHACCSPGVQLYMRTAVAARHASTNQPITRPPACCLALPCPLCRFEAELAPLLSASLAAARSDRGGVDLLSSVLSARALWLAGVCGDRLPPSKWPIAFKLVVQYLGARDLVVGTSTGHHPCIHLHACMHGPALQRWTWRAFGAAPLPSPDTSAQA